MVINAISINLEIGRIGVVFGSEVGDDFYGSGICSAVVVIGRAGNYILFAVAVHVAGAGNACAEIVIRAVAGQFHIGFGGGRAGTHSAVEDES